MHTLNEIGEVILLVESQLFLAFSREQAILMQSSIVLTEHIDIAFLFIAIILFDSGNNWYIFLEFGRILWLVVSYGKQSGEKDTHFAKQPLFKICWNAKGLEALYLVGIYEDLVSLLR